MKNRLLALRLVAIVALGVLVTGIVVPRAQATSFPGPDGGGYSGAAIPFNFVDISTTGTNAFPSSTDDSVTGAIPIGFNFTFYGTAYSNAYIGSNGFVTFSAGQADGCCSGGPLPGTANPSNLVAGWFTDLLNNTGRGDLLLYQTLGLPGSRTFVVEYLNNPYFSSNTPNTFEIILHEGSNEIELQYAVTNADGHNRSVGIENVGGLIGLQIVNDTTTTFSQQGFCLGTNVANAACSTQSVAAPEPASLAVLGAGLVGLAIMKRRRKSS